MRKPGHLAFALVVVTALAAVAAAVHTSAQDQNTNQPPASFMGRGSGGRGGPMGPGGPMGLLPMLPREIQLTDAQRDQMRAVADTHRDEWRALADRARSAHDALNNTITAETVDETTIRAKSADVAAVEADMAVARARVHGEVWQILTTDQKTKITELKAQHGSRRPSPREHF
jgi:periplasmic protein CpxP/Spy